MNRWVWEPLYMALPATLGGMFVLVAIARYSIVLIGGTVGVVLVAAASLLLLVLGVRRRRSRKSGA